MSGIIFILSENKYKLSRFFKLGRHHKSCLEPKIIKRFKDQVSITRENKTEKKLFHTSTFSNNGCKTYMSDETNYLSI